MIIFADTVYLQVNNNGHISFNSPFYASYPQRFEFVSRPLIAPYWADADTRGTGTVWYRETTNQTDIDRAQREIRTIFREATTFTPLMAFIATWDHIGYFPSRTDKV